MVEGPSSVARSPTARPRRLHPGALRLMHWINAAAIITMIGSGCKIYHDEVIFGWLHFPNWITIGGDPDISLRLHGNAGYSGALQWHFLAMWILALNGAAYIVYGIVTGRFRRKLYPIRPSEVVGDIGDALHLRLSHADITRYNAVQKLLYVGIIAVVMVQIMSGLAIWKPVQFASLAALFYDFQGARLAHFVGMSAIVLFLCVHVTLALIVPRTLIGMITGGPLEKPRDRVVAPDSPPLMAEQTGA
jgi:thiosulfate reductase cytochrome b subunit